MEPSGRPEDWGEVVDASRFTPPVVYHFRPNRFVKVAPNRLKEWEQYFMDNVGLTPDKQMAGKLRHGAHARGNLSESMSGSYDGWDDADYV